MKLHHVKRFARCMAVLFAILLITSEAGTSASAGDATTTTAAYYNEVLRTMDALPEPSHISIATHVSSRGIGVRLDEDNGLASLTVGLGGGYNNEASWATDVADPETFIISVAHNKRIPATQPVLKPTWDGALEMLKYGFDGDAALQKTQGDQVSKPADSPAPDAQGGPPALSVIGHIEAIGTRYYRVEDAGSALCPTNAPGKHLHLTPWRDSSKYPLTDIVVELSTKRICSMRFNIGAASALSLTGTYQVRFGQVGDYWLINGSDASMLYRIFGIGAKRASLDFVYVYDAQSSDRLGSTEMHQTSESASSSGR